MVNNTSLCPAALLAVAVAVAAVVAALPLLQQHRLQFHRLRLLPQAMLEAAGGAVNRTEHGNSEQSPDVEIAHGLPGLSFLLNLGIFDCFRLIETHFVIYARK
jgi:hypothetical protein